MPSLKEAKHQRLDTLQRALDLLRGADTMEAAAQRMDLQLALNQLSCGREDGQTVRALTLARSLVGGGQ